MIKNVFVFTCLLIALNMGCATVPIKVTYEHGIDFTQYRTFEWMALPPDPNRHPMASDRETIQQILMRVNRGLASRGLTRAPLQPDILISYEIIVKRQNYLAGSGSSDRTVGRRGSDVVVYRTGDVVLSFFDAKTRLRIWQGSALRVLDSRILTLNEKWQRLDGAIQKMIQKTPFDRS